MRTFIHLYSTRTETKKPDFKCVKSIFGRYMTVRIIKPARSSNRIYGIVTIRNSNFTVGGARSKL